MLQAFFLEFLYSVCGQNHWLKECWLVDIGLHMDFPCPCISTKRFIQFGGFDLLELGAWCMTYSYKTIQFKNA